MIESIYICSFYEGEKEQEAMWEECGQTVDAVVLIIKYQRLFGLTVSKFGSDVIDLVNAIYSPDPVTYLNHCSKNKKFEKENEMRMVYNHRVRKNLHDDKHLNLNDDTADAPTVRQQVEQIIIPKYDSSESCLENHSKQSCGNIIGFIFKVDLNEIIEEIRVHKDASEEYKQEIQQMLIDNNFKDIPVNYSLLK